MLGQEGRSLGVALGSQDLGGSADESFMAGLEVTSDIELPQSLEVV